MLRLLQFEEIEGLFAQSGRLVTLQELRSTDFVPETVSWLKDLERAFEANSLVESALIAGLRSGVDAAAAGAYPPGLTGRGFPSRAKVAALLAGQAIGRAAEIGSGLIAANRPRFLEAEVVAQRLAAGLRSLDLVPLRDLATSHGDWLRATRAVLATRADLEPATVHLEGLVGPYDALMILDRALAAGAGVSPHGLARAGSEG